MPNNREVACIICRPTTPNGFGEFLKVMRTPLGRVPSPIHEKTGKAAKTRKLSQGCKRSLSTCLNFRVDAAKPFYLALGGRMSLDNEGIVELKKMEAARGFPYSAEERDRLIIERGLVNLDSRGA